MDAPESSTSAETVLRPYNYELIEGDDGSRVTVTLETSPLDQAKLWPIVQVGFVDLNRKSFEKQDMTHEEFVADMESPDVYKYLAYDSEGEPVGYLTVHNGLEHISWVDTEMIRAEQAKVDADATSYYVGTLVVTPEKRGTGAAELLLRGAIRHFSQANATTGHDAEVFFDCAGANHPWLAQFIQSVGNQNESTDGVRISVTNFAESYWAKEGDETHFRTGVPPEGTAVLDTEHFYAIQLHA